MVEGKVSVIMPVFNGEKYLHAAANSVLQQTYTNLELLLIDDGSSDASKSIMTELANDKRVFCLFLPKNVGAAAARNAGIEIAKGRFIAFLDTDDLWHPNKLERQIPWMLSENAPLSCTAYEWIEEDGAAMQRIIQVPERVSYRQLLQHNTIGCLTAIYDTRLCGRLLMPNTPQRHDWGLWLSITRQFGDARGLKEVLGSYRVRKESLSANKRQSARYNWVILREYEKLSIPVAVWYYAQFIVRKSMKYLRWTRY